MDYVRINRTPFSGQWEAVKVNKNGVITWRCPIHPDDAETLKKYHQESLTIIAENS
jgi:hypothetical protein